MVDDMSLKKWRSYLEKRRVSRKACETSRIAGTETEDLKVMNSEAVEVYWERYHLWSPQT